MSVISSQFSTMARDSRVTEKAPRITYEGQTTFTKLCTACGFHTPHVLIPNGSRCILCAPAKDNDVIRPTETPRLGR
jgi:hypothetical protein